MKLIYMGSCAYDSIPAPFCTCRVCRNALKVGGKELRSRTQTLINDDLLIEFNSDSISHFHKYLVDTTKIKTCLITHSHSDHLYVEDIVIPQYSLSSSSCDFYCGEDSYKRIDKAIETCAEPIKTRDYIKLHLIEPHQVFEANGYKIQTFRGNHDVKASPIFFAIEKDDKRILYAHDTGVFYDEVYEELKGTKPFDLISLDCTGGLATQGWYDGHMRVETVKIVIDKLKEIKLVNDKTKIVLNHFCHNGFATHEELLEATKDLGYIISYDGLEIEI